MAVVFLVVSRTEKGSVTTATDQTIAGLAADSAIEAAKMDILAHIMGSGNELDVELLVSRNYINTNGFDPNPPGLTSPTNVNYDYIAPASPLTPLNSAQQLQNLANLSYSPRAPVFVGTNNEFRYYLDLNRNGKFDPSGNSPLTNALNLPILDTNGIPMTDFLVGDPQWIGLLERPAFPLSAMNPVPVFNQPAGPPLFPPGYPHSATNKFIGRYAYAVVPATKTLDLNSIYNYAKLLNPKMLAGDGFLRNQGVGPWEINLAAFMVDLNTNMWLVPPPAGLGSAYVYVTNNGAGALPSRGAAFDDATSLLRYRYGANSKTLSSVFNLFGNAGDTAFRNDFVDGYSSGPLMTGSYPPGDFDQAPILRARSAVWAGADNTNHFFTTQDLFDKNKTAIGVAGLSFTDRLQIAGTNNDTYNRYTFYRLLSQLGTDSAQETGKLNLNYMNVDPNGNIAPNMATNFTPWAPIQFFTNIAVRLLANAGYTVGLGPTNILLTNSSGLPGLHIQIYPTNFYSSSLHRMLQLAANLYDATTNRGAQYPYFPSVFQPVFRSSFSGAVFITGYQEVTNLSVLSAVTHDLRAEPNPTFGNNDMVYGIPLVIGAKKGLPNFNEFSMQTRAEVWRRLEFKKPSPTAAVNQTNQSYWLGISNVFGVEAWNSYSNAYPRDMQMIIVSDMTSFLTNENGAVLLTNRVSRLIVTNIAAASWPGWLDGQDPQDYPRSFLIPFPPPTNSFLFLTNYPYQQNPPGFIANKDFFDRGVGFPLPRWWLTINTRLRFILADSTAPNPRILDYVNLDEQGETLDVTTNLVVVDPAAPNHAKYWLTNRVQGSTDVNVPTMGIMNQIIFGMTANSSSVATEWRSLRQDASAVGSVQQQAAFFMYNLTGQKNPGFPSLQQVATFYAPYNPYRYIYRAVNWQANDPLVHYTLNDLTDLTTANHWTPDSVTDTSSMTNFNHRYAPWGGKPGGANVLADWDKEISAKDALVTRSDNWDFPTNKLPNIGWVGRVHRGTPWQTINLKSTNAPIPINLGTPYANWQKWTGNGQTVTNWGQFDTNLLPLHTFGFVGVTNDSVFTHAINDRSIMDLFTTTFNDNGARGQLSINQTNLAAWSAVLSGVMVLSNSIGDFTSIEPAGLYNPFDTNTWPPVLRIVNAINDVRRTNYAGGGFRRLGDFLSVPELTTKSPYLDANTRVLSDAVYERIPQQILGLVKGSEQPRFVVYAYGQALKPAPHSVLTSGPFFGMVTNYQITAETVTRAVIRIEGAPDNPHAVVESYNVLGPDQ